MIEIFWRTNFWLVESQFLTLFRLISNKFLSLSINNFSSLYRKQYFSLKNRTFFKFKPKHTWRAYMKSFAWLEMHTNEGLRKWLSCELNRKFNIISVSCFILITNSRTRCYGKRYYVSVLQVYVLWQRM